MSQNKDVTLKHLNFFKEKSNASVFDAVNVNQLFLQNLKQ